MAELEKKIVDGILGDIKPNPSVRDHMPGGDGNDDEENPAALRSEEESGTGTRNYRSGTATGNDLGNRPE
jgi:hypothetical protein